jgi:hypothetical protein
MIIFGYIALFCILLTSAIGFSLKYIYKTKTKQYTKKVVMIHWLLVVIAVVSILIHIYLK